VPGLSELVEDAEEHVYVGGPVEPGAVIVLAEWDDVDDAGELLLGDVGFPPPDGDPDELRGRTRRARIFAGYAGWSPGQLEAELGRGDWLVEPALPEDVFADDLWERVLRRKGGRYRMLVSMPFDPSLN
jgi:putative transcriptional regulator